ncbi:NAD(P)/FAD-dependent oxidoreductase [Streptomyces sp. NRRL S-1521]|uniref:NAD(P)/FAD-dependent oxidoreductase n=1 Tax=Streptomyces sp. NRRL S-1521 TaxID=1609100 RepID=UPI00074B1256|nr:FAD-dependent oxidoreductase [Streptomyces sp. NRRL S-1521]KUL58728.1 oxidoreductase [Streptomyces sp. NRRL S-1521]
MAETVDAVVVGGGVIGCSTGFELARSGLRVAVVDKLGGAGQGSTSASSAIVRFNYSTLDGVVAAWESKHCWERWSEHVEATARDGLVDYVRTGVVFLDVPQAPRDRVLPLFDQVGVPYDEWGAAELARNIPAVDTGSHWPPKALDDEAFFADAVAHLGGLHTPDGGYVSDPQLAALNLVSAAEKRGTRFFFNAEVTDVIRSGGRVQGVRLSDGTTLSAAVVVNAAGPWSGSLNQLAGVGSEFTIRVRPMRQEVHQVAAPAGYHQSGAPGPVIADLDLGTYMRAEGRDFLLVGGTEPECDPLEWIDDPDRADLRATVPLFNAQVTRAARRLPALRVPSRPSGIAGVYDVADDWTPIYDRTDLDGFYVAIGTSGNQFKNAPLVGRLMTTLVHEVEAGHDHDTEPVHHTCEHTGHVINLGSFSRKRPPSESTGTVMG